LKKSKASSKYKNNVRNMMRFVDAIHDKEKIKVTDEDILSNFLKANPNYLTNYELSIIKKLLKIDQKYLKI
jgi:hypothetical protein